MNAVFESRWLGRPYNALNLEPITQEKQEHEQWLKEGLIKNKLFTPDFVTLKSMKVRYVATKDRYLISGLIPYDDFYILRDLFKVPFEHIPCSYRQYEAMAADFFAKIDPRIFNTTLRLEFINKLSSGEEIENCIVEIRRITNFAGESEIYFDVKRYPTDYCSYAKFKSESVKEKTIMARKSLEIKNIIFNDPATIIIWKDGTKTVVKCQDGDFYDAEKGIAMCVMKHVFGTNETEGNYMKPIKKYLDGYYEAEARISKMAADTISTKILESIVSGILHGSFKNEEDGEAKEEKPIWTDEGLDNKK